MGWAKREWEEYIDRGYGKIPDTFVCDRCIGNEGLQKIIRENAKAKECSYCKRKKR